MGKINWDQVSENTGLPEGRYLVQIIEHKINAKDNGELYHVCKMQVIEPQIYKTWTIRDSFFPDSTKSAALNRIKLFFSRIGMKLTGTQDPEWEKVIGKSVIVETYNDKFIGDKGGEIQIPKVNFNGYIEVTPETLSAITNIYPSATQNEGGLPF